MTPKMNIEHFKEHLEVYGAELARWPEGTQEDALILLQDSSSAQDCFIEASKIDSLFSPEDKHHTLLEKIMENTNDDDGNDKATTKKGGL